MTSDPDNNLNLPPRVAVIGGGWAGLAAAVELCTNGIPVTLFESARQPGGRARKVTVLGQALDNSPHLLIGAYRETLRLMRLVGADPESLLLRLPLVIDAPPHFRLKLGQLQAPWHLANGLAFARGANLADKCRAARFMYTLQKKNYRLDQDEPVSTLLARYGQGPDSPLARYLWEPLCLAALNTPTERASAQVFANVLRDSLGGSNTDTDFLIPRHDLSSIFPDPAMQYIESRGGEIRLSTRVTTLARVDTPTSPGILVNGEHFTAAILATGPAHAAVLIEQIKTAYDAAFKNLLQTLNALEYEPLASVYVRFDTAKASLPEPLLALAGPFGQWVFDLEQVGRAENTLCFILSGAGAWENLDDDNLAKILLGELDSALGTQTLLMSHEHFIIRDQRGTFSCRPDLPRPTAQTPWPELWLAGDATWAEYPATLEGAVRSGIFAGQQVRKFLYQSDN